MSVIHTNISEFIFFISVSRIFGGTLATNRLFVV
jgi:hypothetical protein